MMNEDAAQKSDSGEKFNGSSQRRKKPKKNVKVLLCPDDALSCVVQDSSMEDLHVQFDVYLLNAYCI
ncbi:hypothetical protein E5288_WYG011919 [Bos mutus]|uniref:Uncharacterized protein n=1 Tax=Bos mutus TaxID=72004 RepID=A0A6B0R1Y6_9CETA|nr:hypothetical protein [Bos mutus]